MEQVILASGLAAAAVWLAVSSPGERRLAEPRSWELPVWLRPVPGALAARRRLPAAAAVSAAGLLWGGRLGWPLVLLALAAGAVAFVALGRVTPAGPARRRADVVATLPQACDLLAVAVEAGLPLRRAVEVVAPVLGGPAGEALAGVAARVGLGLPEPDAWVELASEPGAEEVGRALARTVTTGIAIAPTLRELAAEQRRVAAAAALVRARRVGVRSVLPLMCCFLPAFVLLGIVPIFGGIISSVLP